MDHISPRATSVSRGKRRAVFGPDHRLRTRRQLDVVRRQGRSRAGARCVLVAAEGEDGERRLAIIISRRYSPKAVVRNRARRLFREAYRLLYPNLKPMWLILIPRRRMAEARLNDVLVELTGHCRALGVWREDDGSEYGGDRIGSTCSQ